MTLNPYDTKVAAKLARILYSTGERSEGLRLASQAVEFDGSPLADAELTLAFDAYRQKQFGEVLLRLRREINRECYLSDLLLAATLWRLGREDEASPWSRISGKHAPTSSEISIPTCPAAILIRN